MSVFFLLIPLSICVAIFVVAYLLEEYTSGMVGDFDVTDVYAILMGLSAFMFISFLITWGLIN